MRYRIPGYRAKLVRESTVTYISPVERLQSARDSVDLARAILADAISESMIVIWLDASLRVRGWSEVARGGPAGAQAYPSEVFRPPILAGARAVVVAHNHPSGSLDPSPEDLEVTAHLIRAGEVLGVEVLDHIIVTRDEAYSMSSAGVGGFP